MKMKLILPIGLTAALLIGAGAVYAQKKSANNSDQTTIALKNLDESVVSLSDFKGNVTVLAIGATWLPLSREQIAIVNQLQRNYNSRGVNVYFVSTDSADSKSKNFADNAAIKNFAERSKIAAKVLRDQNGTTLKAFNFDQIPAFIVLNKNGEVAATIVGLDVEDNKAATEQIAREIDKAL